MEHDVQAQNDQQDSKDELQAVGDEHTPQVVSPADGDSSGIADGLDHRMRRCTRAVKVTQSIMTSGGKSILLLRPVTFRKTHRVARTRALSSWFAEPNRGQMLA